MEKSTEQKVIRRQKMEDLRTMGIRPFGHAYQRIHKSGKIRTAHEDCMKEELEEKDLIVKIAGRIMAKRRQGKAGFMYIQDIDGQTRIYVRKDVTGEEAYEVLKKSDPGDIVGIEGRVIKINHGESSVKAEVYTHLTKALHPLSEKYHGLQDVEECSRCRYVDSITNENSKRIALIRPRTIRAIQSYLDGEGLVEVETSMLQPILGEASARPFVTYHNTLDMPFYLCIVTELPLKRLIVGGFEGVYEIGRLLRNEGMDAIHNLELTTAEAYVIYSDLSGTMDLVEGLLNHVIGTVCGTIGIEWQDKTVSLKVSLKRLHMMDGIKEACGVDFQQEMGLADVCAIAREHDIEVKKRHSNVGHIINPFFEKYVEETLIQPAYVYGHPVEISSLTKKNTQDPRLADCYELFIDGHEYANVFSELNDSTDQRERFENQLKLRDLGDDEVNEMDMDYVEALEYSLLPTGGVGLGIDRLVMLLTNPQMVREVLLLPHMRLNK